MYRVQYLKYLRVHRGRKNIRTRVNATVSEAELNELKSNPYIRILDIQEEVV